MERTIASCRVVLSLCALVAVYLDPTEPLLLPGLALQGGRFAIDPRTAAVLGTHLVASLTVWGLVRWGWRVRRLAQVTTWSDVGFATVIAAVTEGISSPFYAFFVFAVTAAAVRGGARRAAVVIGVAIGLYLSLIVLSSEGMAFYIMRPVYLAVIGYLIARLGQRRVELEVEVGQLGAQAERSRIASVLHDGSLQALVGVQLRLEAFRALLSAARYEEACVEVGELQEAIGREHDELRRYVRGLAAVGPGNGAGPDAREPRVSVQARFDAPAPVVDDVLQIVREALANVRRHAHAKAAGIVVSSHAGRVTVAVDDDGVGIPAGTDPPWSIAARVRASGGTVALAEMAPGAHLRIALPAGE